MGLADKSPKGPKFSYNLIIGLLLPSPHVYSYTFARVRKV